MIVINWRDITHSEDDYRTDHRNVSHCQQQQSYSGLRSTGRSNSTYFWMTPGFKPFTRRELETKCVSQLFLQSLLETRRSSRARSIQPKFPEISVQNSMDRFGPTGKVSKKLVHLLRWSSFPGGTGLNFGWMDRAPIGQFFFLVLYIATVPEVFAKVNSFQFPSCCRNRGFRFKTANFSRLHCLAIPKRDLSTKKTKPNKEK